MTTPYRLFDIEHQVFINEQSMRKKTGIRGFKKGKERFGMIVENEYIHTCIQPIRACLLGADE